MKQNKINGFILFTSLWVTVFFLYLPAMQAGRVTDFTGWLQHIQQDRFWDYINRKSFTGNSFYQFTQFASYIFYRLFGIHPLLWHLLYITVHVVNCLLLYNICFSLFQQSGSRHTNLIVLSGILLFCLNPHLSEVIVWIPSFHYTISFLFILLILYQTQRYQANQKITSTIAAAAIFIVSVFSLEIFYITPWLVLSLAIYYRLALKQDKQVFNKTVCYIVLPQMVIILGYFITYHLVYGAWIAHLKGDILHHSYAYFLSKPAKYLFHVLLFGRFFSHETRERVYLLCESAKGIVAFWGLFLFFVARAIFKMRSAGTKGKTVILLSVWCALCLVILTPMWFPELFVIECDRYTYFLNAFLYMLLTYIMYSYINKNVAIVLISAYALANVYLLEKLNRNWKQSNIIINNLLHTLPEVGNKTILLLNLPQTLNGANMIPADSTSEYQLIYEEFNKQALKNNIYDVASYNLMNYNDGVHVNVVNDSTLRVTLNQWGTWWWRNNMGGVNYETPDYKMNMVDMGRYYELVLKKPRTDLEIVFQHAGIWKEVSWQVGKTDQY